MSKSDLNYPDWRVEELGRKYAPADAYERDEVECERCEEFDEVHGPQCPEHPDYDPTPWCSGCGARKKADCDCGGPIDPMD